MPLRKSSSRTGIGVYCRRWHEGDQQAFAAIAGARRLTHGRIECLRQCRLTDFPVITGALSPSSSSP